MTLTPEQWLLVQPLLPVSGKRRGRPAPDPRPVLDAILHKLTHRLPWRSLPPAYPPWQTCFRQYLRWKETGILHMVNSKLVRDLVFRGGLDPDTLLRDGSIQLLWHAGHLCIYYNAALPLDWRVETALLYYQFVCEFTERTHHPDGDYPLLEIGNSAPPSVPPAGSHKPAIMSSP